MKDTVDVSRQKKEDKDRGLHQESICNSVKRLADVVEKKTVPPIGVAR